MASRNKPTQSTFVCSKLESVVALRMSMQTAVEESHNDTRNSGGVSRDRGRPSMSNATGAHQKLRSEIANN